MTKNPLVNAFAAMLYISLVASVLFYGPKQTAPVNSVIVPIAMISLFTLSAAAMGYFFCFTPLQLYFDGKKKQAVNLFAQTVFIFGVFTVVALGLLLTGLGRYR